ncbi:hypothetical protein H6F42_20080 [Pseudanabaena sp. FACHB-1998]|uniref:hypothetical protein n=1 Tax=Pseudanabaena sp. FACHB-1998 TaxID=2692858 RepID=UPI001680F245|nr:hypothetical protein [Pseudanabaena sp. FACHB-1998]MBD2179226.1 hypothetical protein [Pseudanabaena sp. FACHB-1998]
MTKKRYKSILCGLLLLTIAIHPEQHHVEEKYPKIIHPQNRRQRRRRKGFAVSH